MLTLLWDASGLSKRYVPEVGRDAVMALFAAVPLSQMLTTFLGYAETQAVLVRKRNRNMFSEAAYAEAATALQEEVIDNEKFIVLDVAASAILAGIDLIKKHNLNASDAAILVTFLRYAAAEAEHSVCVLVCADQRFIRAAEAEGLRAINPEMLSAADAPSVLASF